MNSMSANRSAAMSASIKDETGMNSVSSGVVEKTKAKKRRRGSRGQRKSRPAALRRANRLINLEKRSRDLKEAMEILKEDPLDAEALFVFNKQSGGSYGNHVSVKGRGAVRIEEYLAQEVSLKETTLVIRGKDGKDDSSRDDEKATAAMQTAKFSPMVPQSNA